jgi:hypothetical protein
MSIILLRTLTEKSIIQNGKNKGFPVGDLLLRCKTDLIYSYFNYANITFTPEIIEKLKIRPEDIIKKPGKAPEKFEFYSTRNNYMVSVMKVKSQDVKTEIEQPLMNWYYKRRRKAIFKGRFKGMIERERIIYSKANMQRRNHGR